MAYCPNCGTEIQSTGKFCTVCGKDVGATPNKVMSGSSHQADTKPETNLAPGNQAKDDSKFAVTKETKTPTLKSKGMPTATKVLLGIVIVVLAYAGISNLTNSMGGQPDIRVENVRTSIHLNISVGYYADVSYTLHNYGTVDGRVTTSISGSSSGSIVQETFVVPAQQAIEPVIPPGEYKL